MDIAFFIAIILILGAIAWRLWRPSSTDQEKEIGKLSERVDTSNKIWEGQFEKIRKELSEARREESALRDGTSKTLLEQVGKFAGSFGEMKTELEKIDKEVKEVSSFQNIFKSPKLTGEWGEASLEYLLAQYFQRKDSYQKQHQFSSGEKVDFALTLPNGRILSIDSKYPHDIFTQFINATDEQEKETLRKNLISRVKKDIDDIATKYILPNENTVDFAVMYVPAESLYYEIISKEDINTYAWTKKVAVASPNNFVLTIAIIMDWFKKADISKRADAILKKLQRVKIDGEQLANTFRKLDKHLSDARSSYDDSEKRLNLLVDRVDDATNLIGGESTNNAEPVTLEAPQVEDE